MSVYADFLASKSRVIPDAGRQSDIADLSLFDHQRALVQWALRRGRCALFADTGLGKTRMELAWAHSLGVDTLILTPLAVAQQMVAEGMDIGVDVNVVREGGDVRPGINVCNYERIHKLDCSRFQAVVLDESSVIKHADTRTFATLTDTFKRTRIGFAQLRRQPRTIGPSWERTRNFSAFARGSKCSVSFSCMTAATRKSGGSRGTLGANSGNGLPDGVQWCACRPI